MRNTNPYAAPKAAVADVGNASAEDEARLLQVASGQKLIIYAPLANLASMALQAVIGAFAGFIGLAASVVAIVGAVRLAGGLGRGGLSKTLYAISMLLPLINLLIMVSLSAQATKALRVGGYTVGLLGAKMA